jgi:TolB-like protein/Tfp pilus assembly protein PilF
VELEKIIQKALSKDVSERYQHSEDLVVDIKRVKKNLTSGEKYTISKKKPKTFKKQSATAVIALLIIITAGYFMLIKKAIIPEPDTQKTIEKPAITRTAWKNSIAVLPFADLSSQKDQEYFCDGMTDDLITRLTRIRELKVIARTSVLRYKNSQKDIKEIGRELGVDTILEGSIQKEKDRIRINAQLINVSDSSHLWADRFDERLESVFDLQDRVTASIAEALKMKFIRPSADTLKNSQPKNIEAFEYYLQGMHYIKTKYTVSLDERDFQTSLKMFTKAIQIDKNYALAYAGLAFAHYHHLINTGDDTGWDRWKENINIAYQLDPNSAFINAGMGLTAVFNHEHEQASIFFKNALKLNPNISLVPQTIGFVFHNRGLYKKSLPYLHRAIELDPFYIWSRAHLAVSLSSLGEFEKADIYFQQNLELDPNDMRHFCYYAVQFLKKKQFAKAAELIKKAEKIKLLHPQAPYSNISYYKSLLYASRDEKEKALAIYKQPDSYIYSLLGMKGKAINRLIKYTNKSKTPQYLDLKYNPFFDNLRDDPRFHKIVKKERKKYEDLIKKYGDL